VQLLPAGAKPDAAAGAQAGGLLQFREPEQLAVEAPRLALAPRWRRQLHVIEPVDGHAAINAK
jgi:hypothetical protein